MPLRHPEDLKYLAREIGRVALLAGPGQDIQITRTETEHLVDRLEELKELRRLVFGAEDVVATPQSIERAATGVEQELIRKGFSGEGAPSDDAILQLLLSKLEQLVRIRRECRDLKIEQRKIHLALASINVGDDASALDEELAERHPTLALVERLRVSHRRLSDEIAENEWLWSSDDARESAHLRSSLENVLLNQRDEDWSLEELTQELEELLKAPYLPANESRAWIEELTAPFRERIRVLENVVTKAQAAVARDEPLMAQSLLGEALRKMETSL